MSDQVDTTLAALIVKDKLASKAVSYAAGLGRPLTTGVLTVKNNTLSFEVVDIVSRKRAKFTVTIEENK